VIHDGKSPGAFTWDATPGATEYEVYIGTRSTLPGLATQAIDSCQAGSVPSPMLPLPGGSVVPPPGQMVWFHVTAKGPYGEGPLQPGSKGPRQLNSAGFCHDSCAHSPCNVGGPLVPACTLTASIVCEADPACCDPVNGSWDLQCVQKVRTVAGSLVCPESQGQCAHSACTVGAPLAPGCDAPPLPVSCTAKICQADPHCCQQQWDAACIDKVAPVCGYNCL